MRGRRDISDALDDAGLLRACLAGDQEAWTELVTRYTRLVYSIALKSGLDEHDAGDVVQNVFTIVLRRLESLQDPPRFSAWLITTTHRESWRLRKTQRQTVPVDGVEPVDPDPSAESLVVASEQAATTHQALDWLGERSTLSTRPGSISGAAMTWRRSSRRCRCEPPPRCRNRPSTLPISPPISTCLASSGPNQR